MIVYLVGAGPGDPGLITARGLELIRACDVLVFDRLVARELLDEAPVGAMRIGRETLSQEAINRLLIELARAGRRVVRLKGGDPFLFGRGGEEVDALARAGIQSEVVPGVSSLSAVPAAAGIPITHRGVSAQVTIAAGSGAGGALGLDLDALARAPGTIVLFMSLGRLAEIVDGLIVRGRYLLTPAAVIAAGTRATQRTVSAPLHELPAAALAARLDAPALVVIGHVVELAETLAESVVSFTERKHKRHVDETGRRDDGVMMPSGIVIVGGGIAGQAVCEAVRECDREVPVTLVCGEPRLPYDRVRLSDLLASGQDVSDLVLRPEEWYEDRGVDVRLGGFVERIDAAERMVVLADGAELGYHRLVLATGSQPLLPPIPGIDLPGVRAFRGPEDCEAIREAAGRSVSAAVIGGGLLGLEAARGVAAQGCPVTVVHLRDRLMERQLDPGAAALLLPAMAELGVDVLLERETERILGDGRAERLRFVDGEELPADLVVVSMGIRPETALARSAGITCDRGIVVDDHMETSLAGVLAVGECAQHRGTVYGLVAPIHDQAHVAARTLLERRNGGYAGTVASAKLKVMGIDLVAIGDTEGSAAAFVTDASGRVYRKLVVTDGVATGAILLGDTRGAESLLESVRRGEAVDDLLARLVQAAEATAADLPAEAQVCNCNGVSKQTIVVAVHDTGCTSTREVIACTRAGTGCGSCKSLVAEIVSHELGGAIEEPHYLCACRRQTRDELAAVVRDRGFEAVSEVAAACGTGHDCGACKPALAYLVSEVNNNLHREERDARFINDRVHANIQHDGTFSVVPRIYGGVVTPDELRRIADVADKYQVRMVKITGGQRIDLLGVRKEELPEVWRDLGMPSGHAYAKAVRTVKTCVGTEFCRYGIGDAVGLGIEMEKEWEGLYTPAKVKSAVSGCPRNCAEASVKDIGVIAVEGGWEVLVGGAAGGTVRKADLLVKVETRREALLYSTIALQYYRENAEYRERWYDFVVRVGLDTVREIVLGAETGVELLERFRLAKAAVRDPWLERDDPYHPNQFRSELDPPELAEAREE